MAIQGNNHLNLPKQGKRGGDVLAEETLGGGGINLLSFLQPLSKRSIIHQSRNLSNEERRLQSANRRCELEHGGGSE